MPGLRQAVEQDAPVLLVAVLDRLHLGAPVERRLGRDLGQRRHRDREIALQALDRADERLRQHHPADAPAGHAEIFRERVDDDGVVGELRGGLGRERIVEAVIDLVGDEPDPRAFRGVDEIAQRRIRHHGAGRVGGARDQHALERRRAMRGEQHLGRDRPARRLRRLDRHRLAAERAEDVTIGRIARQRDRDPVAGLEQRQEGEHESGRRSGGDGDARRIDLDAVSFAVVPRNARAQRSECRASRYSRCVRTPVPRARPRSRCAAPAPPAGRPPCG